MKKPCRQSGKPKYDTHEQAAMAAGRVLTDKPYNKKYSTPKVLWTYKCLFCGKWHLTSKDQSISRVFQPKEKRDFYLTPIEQPDILEICSRT
jgi:hypothetical protein